MIITADFDSLNCIFEIAYVHFSHRSTFICERQKASPSLNGWKVSWSDGVYQPCDHASTLSYWQLKWISLIISLQCNAQVENLGSWHTCGCSLTHKIHQNIDSDEEHYLKATALPDGCGPSSKTMCPLKNCRNSVKWAVTMSDPIHGASPIYGGPTM